MQTANLRHTSFLAAAAIVALALPAHAQTRLLDAFMDPKLWMVFPVGGSKVCGAGTRSQP